MKAPGPCRSHSAVLDNPASRLAGAIAGRIHQWIDRGEILPSKGRPVGPGDIMILVRRRGGFVHEMVRALKERDIDVAGVDRMVLSDPDRRHGPDRARPFPAAAG